jgi:hypothetical protein
MATPISTHALAALLEIQRSRCERLTASCVVAEAEDQVAQVRCAQILDEFAGRARHFSRCAERLAGLAEPDGSASAVAGATVALDAARIALTRAHLRTVQEWVTISQARLERARDLTQQIGRISAVISATHPPGRPDKRQLSCPATANRPDAAEVCGKSRQGPSRPGRGFGDRESNRADTESKQR